MLDGVHCLPVPGMILWGRDFPTDLSPGFHGFHGFHGFCQPSQMEQFSHPQSMRQVRGGQKGRCFSAFPL